MRDFIILSIIFGSLPFCFMRPYIGVLMWIWIGLMNPHQFGWASRYFPVALLIAIPTLVGTVFSAERKKFPFVRETWLLIFLLLWFGITTYSALVPQEALKEWDRVWKIFLMVFVTLFLFQNQKKLRIYFWIIALSIGFFAVKGAFFAILSQGQYIIFGPARSFIEDNNALALAELMVLPFLFGLGKEEKNIWLKRIFYFIGALTIIAIIFSYSRGALLSLIAVSIFFVLSIAKKKVLWIGLICVLGISATPFVPVKWFDRMATISTFQEDRSAMGRINAWHFAYNLAADRPILGGGFRVFQREMFIEYAPNPSDVHDSHSIYFEILAEQGYPGLILFVSLLLSSYFSIKKISRAVRQIDTLTWIENYCKMLRVSLVAYCVGGAFLGLAYFDLFYFIVAGIILLKMIVRDELVGTSAGEIEKVNLGYSHI